MAALATIQHNAEDGSGEGAVQIKLISAPPEKEDKQKVQQFIREAEKNKRQIEKLEKGATLISQCKKNGWTDISSEIEEYEKCLERERDAERKTQRRKLTKVHNVVGIFQRHLTDVKPTPNLIERLKDIMAEVEATVNNLKEEQQSSVEECLKEERTCKQEVAACEKKIENWNLAAKPNPRQIQIPSLRTKLLERDLPVEVRALESFLQKSGGPSGGWDQFDHQIFLRFWLKHGGHPYYREEVRLYLSSKSMGEIEQHEEWYLELQHLQDKKREAIKHWKARKDQERQIRLEQEKEMIQKRQQNHRSPTEKQRMKEEKMEVARQLEKWREQKKKKEEQEEEKRLSVEIQKRRREKEERRRQLEVKLVLEEQLRLKREEEEDLRRRKISVELKEMEEKKKEAAKVIKYFSERDLLKVEAKVFKKQFKEREEEERQRRIAAKLKEKVDSHISKDRSRLIRPTKGWEERMKHIGPSGAGPVFQISHRAVPTWRQGL